MPSKWTLEIISVGATLIGLIIGFFLIRRRLPISPRQTRRQSRLTLFFSALCGGAAIFTFLGSNLPQHRIIVVISFTGIGIAAALLLYEQIRALRPHEAAENFAVDSRHCGRCEYDLNGNVSGICPECGWTIPQGALDIDSPGWALWWRKWQIDHLRNWHGTLTMLIFWAVVFAATAMLAVIYLQTISTALLPAIMAVQMSINAARVVAYGHRIRTT